MNPSQTLEDPDYDPFAQWRPRGIQVDDNIADELDGEHASNSDDLAQFRPNPQEIDAEKARKRGKVNPTFKESAKDYAKQFVKEGLIGLGGTWGDLTELAGLNKNPGAEARNKSEFETLKRMEQPGYKPSFLDIYSLSDDDIAPNSFSLPTSQNLRDVNEMIGGPGEPETTAGRFGARQGKLYGSGAAIGQLNPVPALLAGTVGQGVEELGGGELAQAAAEIATFLVSPGGGAKAQLGARASKEVKKRINDLRKIGYNDEEITLAINSASKGKKLGLKASKGAKAEQAFENFGEKSTQLIGDILEAEIPGIEHGTKHVHQMASDFYGQVASAAENLAIKDSTPFINSATKIVKELKKNLGDNPEAQAMLKRMYDAVVASTNQPSARHYMEFYKELNSMGNWLGRSQKDRLINMAKDGIKDTFRSEGPAGKKLAQEFEKANVGVRKAFQAEDLHNLIQKSVTQDGTNFKTLYKIFDNPKNVELFEDVLGATQANNVRQIAKTAKEVKDFDKAWKAASIVPQSLKSYATHAAYLLYSGNWPALAAIKGGELAARKLSEKALTDPKFQHLMIRGLHAVKNNSPRTLRSSIDAMQEYLDDNDIKVNLHQTKD